MRTKRTAVNLLFLGNVERKSEIGLKIFVYLVNEVLAGRLDLPLEVETEGDPYSDRLSVGPETHRLAFYRSDLPPKLFKEARTVARVRPLRQHCAPKRFRGYFSIVQRRPVSRNRRDWASLYPLFRDVKLERSTGFLEDSEWMTNEEILQEQQRERVEARRLGVEDYEVIQERIELGLHVQY